MRRGALIAQGVLILAAVTVCISFLFSFTRSAPSTASAEALFVAVDLELALQRLALDPRTLAAAGLASEDVQALAAAALEELQDSANALSAADSAFAAARAETDHLLTMIRSGEASEEDVEALATVSAARDAAAAQRDSLLSAIAAAALAAVPANQAAALAAMRSNREWDLPAEYRAADRSQMEWVQLREALAAERIAAGYGFEQDEDAQTLLAGVRTEPAVSLAIANVQTHLDAVLLAWDEAVQGTSE